MIIVNDDDDDDDDNDDDDNRLHTDNIWNYCFKLLACF